MADSGVVKTYLSGLESNARRALGSIFDYILKDIRFGRVPIDDIGERSVNLGGGLFRATTPSVANEEFSVEHNFGRTPYLLIQVMPGDVVGAKLIRLENTRAWDASRVYLRSPETSATFYFYLEG